MTEIANCKLCGGNSKISEYEDYWGCDTCGIYGPDDDRDGKKWNRLMAPSVAATPVRRPIQVVNLVEIGVGVRIVKIDNDWTVWYLGADATWKQIPLLPQTTPEEQP